MKLRLCNSWVRYFESELDCKFMQSWVAIMFDKHGQACIIASTSAISCGSLSDDKHGEDCATTSVAAAHIFFSSGPGLKWWRIFGLHFGCSQMGCQNVQRAASFAASGFSWLRYCIGGIVFLSSLEGVHLKSI
ncbi:hypothetical protein OIU77_012010 [Salix suchowensis]|uniref:Uncharacterized protein n=1 Tax=Salix suchowensis TaxID=1278906 RepID=A0ABQ9A328_9ROSI|nr:hypothetical protein OIU77_012010 [Salix suchowensis]KAJ6350942.1 hypothetical protein OIU78_006959 [Salix suchowensis]